MQYKNYVTLRGILVHMHCIGDESADSTDSVNSVIRSEWRRSHKCLMWSCYLAPTINRAAVQHRLHVACQVDSVQLRSADCYSSQLWRCQNCWLLSFWRPSTGLEHSSLSGIIKGSIGWLTGWCEIQTIESWECACAEVSWCQSVRWRNIRILDISAPMINALRHRCWNVLAPKCP